MFWKRWNLGNYILRKMARAKGFLDPVAVFAKLQRFSKPSEVWVPTELLRSGAILQARGLMNSQAIQHNLDWVWPFWVTRQFNPMDDAFIPRAFNITHINMTHRNWTALGVPGFDEYPLVDPRGLVTPFFDGWSIDAWIVAENKASLIPSRSNQVKQVLGMGSTLSVQTTSDTKDLELVSRAEVIMEMGIPVCRVSLSAKSKIKARLVVTVRPYNPEGVSFVHQIQKLPGHNHGWTINKKENVYLNQPPSRYIFSNYIHGDVFSRLFVESKATQEIDCEVGMATAAACYEISDGGHTEVSLDVPLLSEQKAKTYTFSGWEESLKNACRLEIPDEQFQFLYDAALRTFILHSPGDVFPGPFTYRRFWFRDAAFILDAMLCVNLPSRVEKVLDHFPSRQTPLGYFLSQDGEWDSNGEALWILERFCRMTKTPPKPAWANAARKASLWIQRKRLSKDKTSLHAGLFPAGFSAEHLGPNDYYYWDDFWGIAGLRSAAYLMDILGDTDKAGNLRQEAVDFLRCVKESLGKVKERLGYEAIPASPYRRMDAGAIGSMAASYPLQILDAKEEAVTRTVEYLINNCLLNDGFYQEISHSGINAYLTLHIAQVLLQAGDARFMDLTKAIAKAATSTGQWPEAIHPRTQGGCMGDGQHVWAAAEWVLILRNMFVREEEKAGKLILGSGIPKEWLIPGKKIFFGPAPTLFGEISITIIQDENIHISWEARWHEAIPSIEIRLPGFPPVMVAQGKTSVEIKGEKL